MQFLPHLARGGCGFFVPWGKPSKDAPEHKEAFPCHCPLPPKGKNCAEDGHVASIGPFPPHSESSQRGRLLSEWDRTAGIFFCHPSAPLLLRCSRERAAAGVFWGGGSLSQRAKQGRAIHLPPLLGTQGHLPAWPRRYAPATSKATRSRKSKLNLNLGLQQAPFQVVSSDIRQWLLSRFPPAWPLFQQLLFVSLLHPFLRLWAHFFLTRNRLFDLFCSVNHFVIYFLLKSTRVPKNNNAGSEQVSVSINQNFKPQNPTSQSPWTFNRK